MSSNRASYGSPKLAILFLFLVAPLCLLLAALVPVGQVADEPSHALKAESLSHFQLVGRRGTITAEDGRSVTVAGVDADPAVVFAENWLPLVGFVLTRETLDHARQVPWGQRTFMQLANIATYFPAFYVPAAVAIASARHLGVAPHDALRAARFTNAILYILLATAALRVARAGQGLLFCALAMPMSLSLGASINQDGLIIATTALAAALVSRAWADSDSPVHLVRHPAYWLAALALAVVIVTKPPYFPLAGLLLPPLGEWRSQRGRLLRRFGVLCACVLPAVLWSWFVLANVAAAIPRLPYQPGPLWPGDPSLVFGGTDASAQLKVLLAVPSRFILLPLQSLWIDSGSLLRQMIGVLGYLNLSLPDLLYGLWTAGLIVACAADLMSGQALPRRGRWADALLLLLCATASIFAVWLSQYLTWTNVGEAQIAGPQGRYLLPLLPMLAMMLACFGLSARQSWAATLRCFLAIPAAASLIGLPAVIVSAYYLH